MNSLQCQFFSTVFEVKYVFMFCKPSSKAIYTLMQLHLLQGQILLTSRTTFMLKITLNQMSSYKGLLRFFSNFITFGNIKKFIYMSIFCLPVKNLAVIEVSSIKKILRCLTSKQSRGSGYFFFFMYHSFLFSSLFPNSHSLM